MTTLTAPPRWKRLIYSIVSAILGVAIALSGLSFLQSPHATFREMWMGALFFGIIALVPCVCGWLIGLPFVLLVTNFRKWRFLIYWAIGTALGPIVIVGYALYLYARTPHATGPIFPASFAWFAAAVACLTTLFYLLLVRYDQHRIQLRNARNTP